LKPRLVIITGLAGSGKTITLRALEDCGYSCVDNLPPQLIAPLADTLTVRGERTKVAVGVDVRESQFLHEMDSALKGLVGSYEVEIIFLEAEVDVLMRRFKETRRPHPLMTSVNDLTEAISREKELLNDLRDKAHRIVDTSQMNPHQLRSHMMSLCGMVSPGDYMHVTVMSFGFKHGIPQSADMVFDVRFLPNPHFVQGLRELSGLDREVREYVLDKPATMDFIGRVHGFLDHLIPQYAREGRAYLTVAIGCTGGRHRSTVIAEELTRLLDRENLDIRVLHRDI
jgi:UPF0042 nucleotide-binding protein